MAGSRMRRINEVLREVVGAAISELSDPRIGFVDFDVLGTVDPTSFVLTGVGHYAEMVREARRQRRLVDGGLTDWVVVRNRLSTLGSRNKRLVGEGVDELGRPTCDGVAEADALKGESGDLDALARRGYGNEALDQLVVDVLLGV